VETLAPRLGDNRAEQPRLHGSAGVVATAYLQGEQTQHGRPTWVVACDHQPDAREGQAGLRRESDGPIVPVKRVTTVEGRGLS